MDLPSESAKKSDCEGLPEMTGPSSRIDRIVEWSGEVLTFRPRDILDQCRVHHHIERQPLVVSHMLLRAQTDCTRHQSNATRWLKPCHKSVSSGVHDLHGSGACLLHSSINNSIKQLAIPRSPDSIVSRTRCSSHAANPTAHAEGD